MKIAKTLALALALIVPLAAVSARPAEAQASVSVGVFYNSLAPYGDWHVSANYGYVWRPTTVYAGWRPYHDGRWVNTNVGWTFVGNDAWGWATYHYGRWYFDPYYGWVWVPGYEWGPAWVSFYEGPGYIGWAPLAPNVTFGVTFGGGGYGGGYYDPRGYNFVESRYFLASSVGRWVQPVDRNVSLVRQVRDVSRFDRVDGMVVNRGLAVDRVERATRSRVRTFQLADQPGGGRALRSEIRGDTLAVYRPHVEKRASERPAKVKEGRPARFEEQRDHSSAVRRDESPAKSPKMDSAPRSSKPEERARPSLPSSHPTAKVERPATSSRQPAQVEKHAAAPPSGSKSSTVTRKPVTAPAQAQKSKVSKPVTAPTQTQKGKVSKPVEKRTSTPPPQRSTASSRGSSDKRSAVQSTHPKSGQEQKVQGAQQKQDPRSTEQVRSKSATEKQQADKASEGKGKASSKSTKKSTTKRKPPQSG